MAKDNEAPFDLSKATINGEPIGNPEETPPAETPPQETPPEETPPSETPPAETPPAETPPEETPPSETPPAEIPPEETPPADTPPAETPPAEVPPAPIVDPQVKALQELLDDDYFKKVVDYYKENKNLQPFLEAYANDFEKLGDEEVLRFKFDRDNQDLNPSMRNKLFQKEVMGMYEVDEEEFSEDDAALNEEREVKSAIFKRDANRVRQELIKTQKEHQQSLAPQNQGPSEAELTQMRDQNIAAAKQAMKNVLESGSIAIESEGAKLNYTISDTQSLVDNAVISGKMMEAFVNQDKSINWDKFVQVNAFMQDPAKYNAELVKQGKSLGRAEFEAEMKNQDLSPQGQPPKDLNSPTGHPLDNPKAFLEKMIADKQKK